MRTQGVGIAVAFVVFGLAAGTIGGTVATMGGRTSWGGFWPVYVAYLVVAGVLGFASPARAWLAGAMMMPAHSIVVLATGAEPHTSTMAVGHLITLMASIPLAFSGYCVGKFSRSRRRE